MLGKVPSGTRSVPYPTYQFNKKKKEKGATARGRAVVHAFDYSNHNRRIANLALTLPFLDPHAASVP